VKSFAIIIVVALVGILAVQWKNTHRTAELEPWKNDPIVRPAVEHPTCPPNEPWKCDPIAEKKAEK
jgi:hypothetical protein